MKKGKTFSIMLLIPVCVLLSVSACSKKQASKTEEDIFFEELEIPKIEMTDAEEYFEENGEILDRFALTESNSMLSEADVIKLLKDRGFTDLMITTSYDTEGNIVEPFGISPSSNDKHPIYEADYISSDGIIWVVSVIDKSITANPLSYNLDSGNETMTVITESDQVTSFDNATKKFFVTIPEESALITIKVGRIDAETLAGITVEDLKR